MMILYVVVCFLYPPTEIFRNSTCFQKKKKHFTQIDICMMFIDSGLKYSNLTGKHRIQFKLQ